MHTLVSRILFLKKDLWVWINNPFDESSPVVFKSFLIDIYGGNMNIDNDYGLARDKVIGCRSSKHDDDCATASLLHPQAEPQAGVELGSVYCRENETDKARDQHGNAANCH